MKRTSRDEVSIHAVFAMLSVGGSAAPAPDACRSNTRNKKFLSKQDFSVFMPVLPSLLLSQISHLIDREQAPGTRLRPRMKHTLLTEDCCPLQIAASEQPRVEKSCSFMCGAALAQRTLQPVRPHRRGWARVRDRIQH